MSGKGPEYATRPCLRGGNHRWTKTATWAPARHRKYCWRCGRFAVELRLP
jgi:hypothetical protein